MFSCFSFQLKGHIFTYLAGSMQFTLGSEPTLAAPSPHGIPADNIKQDKVEEKTRVKLNVSWGGKTLTRIRSFMKILNNVNMACLGEFDKICTNLR